MARQTIQTSKAPAAIGPYSPAVRSGDTVYCSGQIPLEPVGGEVVAGGAPAQIRQVFENLTAVAEAAGGSLADAVKLTIYLTDLTHFPVVNEIMTSYFEAPYPARAVIGVAALPRGVLVEMDAILQL